MKVKALPLVLLLAALAISTPAFTAPVVFWHSDPILPGETVLVIGDGFGTQPTVEIARLADGAPGTTPGGALTWPGKGDKAEVLQPADNALKFVVPAAAKPGVFFYRIAGAAVGVLNRPTGWWLQGDLGTRSTPGGWVRVLGKNLGWTDKDSAAKTTILLKGPKTVVLPAEGGVYSAQAALPKDLPAGKYEVFVHNGRGGAGAWSEPLTLPVEQPKPWPAKVFSVADLGADASGQQDCTEAVNQALAAAEKNGGGVVYFPRGRYQITAGLKVPRFTVPRGEKREWVSLLWPDTATPPEALIRGTNSFGVEDLTIYASRHQHIIAGDLGDQPEAGNVHLRRVRVRADAYWGHLKPEEADAILRDALKLSTGGGDTVRLGGEGIEITDCDLYGSGRCLFLSRTRGGVVQGNTLSNGRWGWYCISGSDGLVFADNALVGGDLMSTGGGLNCLDGSNYSQNVYYAHNTLRLMHGWDREAMTSDAGGGAYFGGVAATEGTTVTLSDDPEAGRDWAGAGLFILDGRGRGQYRRIVSVQGRAVTVDRPWEVPPDKTSTVSLTMVQTHYLFIGNTFSDAGVAIQLYGTAIEDIADGNTSERTAGFHNFGMKYYGIQPSWFNQWLGNEIREGNSYRSGHDNYLLAGEAHLGIFALPPSVDFKTPITLGCIARRNRLLNNAHLAVGGSDPYNPVYEAPTTQEVIVENNEIADSQVGISLRRATSGVLLRGNHFTRVAQEVWDEAALRKVAQERRQKLLASPTPLATWTWRLGDLKGSVVPDATGNRFDAQTIGKLALEAGRQGQAARLGDESYLRIDEPELFNLQSFTVALWIKPDTVEGRHGLVVKRFVGTAAPFVLSLWNRAIEFEGTAVDGKWSFNFRTPEVLKPNEWTHVAAVAEQGKGVTIYLNGEPAAHIDNALDHVGNNEPLIIGREAWAGEQNTHHPCYYQGLMDEVKVWGRALTAEEIKAEAK